MTPHRHYWRDNAVIWCACDDGCWVCELERKEVVLLEAGYTFARVSDCWQVFNYRGIVVGVSASRQEVIESVYMERE